MLCHNDLQNRYAVDVYNRFEALSEQMVEPSTDDIYEALIATNAEVAGNIPAKKRKRKEIISELSHVDISDDYFNKIFQIIFQFLLANFL